MEKSQAKVDWKIRMWNILQFLYDKLTKNFAVSLQSRIRQKKKVKYFPSQSSFWSAEFSIETPMKKVKLLDLDR